MTIWKQLHTLSQNKMPNTFFNVMAENVEPHSTLILGVSGGPDSVFLLYKCLEITEKIPLKLVVAHVNHNLRPKESQKDADFVEKLAKKNNLTFESTELNLADKQKSGFEAAGRALRYQFFEKLRKKYKAGWILTAHHRGDNIETVLFNLIRGANLTGLKGIEKAIPTRHLLRPMLDLSKNEIITFLKSKKILYRVDQTNKQLHFSRNWLRHKVIPLFKKINGNFEETFAANIENFAETADFIETCCVEWLKNGFPLDEFLQIHPALQKNILVYLYKKTHGSTQQLTYKSLREILKVLKQKKAGCKKEFGTKHFLVITRGSEGKRIAQITHALKKESK